MLFVFYPLKPAHAGLLSHLIDYFVGTTSASESVESLPLSAISMPLLGSKIVPPEEHTGEDFFDESMITVIQDNAIIGSRNPLGTLAGTQDTIVVYTVEQGDTLSGVAAKFGVSINTILWANNIRNPKSVKIGDELVILPVTGIQYKVKKGDTLESIAKVFKPKNEELTQQEFLGEIISFNGLAIGEVLETGSTLIIPEGEISLPASAPKTNTKFPSQMTTRITQYPTHQGYYMRPIIGGRRSRGIHGYNGVDLANTCGLSLLASAAGNVIVVRASGWNGGYGKYVVISHPNGTQTLYAHMQSIFISAGQYVTQGFQIGQIGTTGNSTGCHVHFEIRGAKNPF